MIGKALKYMRSNAGFSQEQISKLIGFARNTISQYETQTLQAEFYTIEKIANECGYKIYFINEKTKDKFQIKDLERKDI